MKTYSIKDLNLPVILFVGRPTDLNKGIEVFFRAITRLYNINQKFATWIIGGEESEVLLLKSWIVSNSTLNEEYMSGRIILWGRIENESLPEFYSRATVCAMPSFNETFGMVAVESMLCECPVIASNIGGLRNVIKDGFSGFLVEPGYDLIITMYMYLLLNNQCLRDWLSKNSVNWALRNFSKAASFSFYPSCYRREQKTINTSELAQNKEIEELRIIIVEDVGEFRNIEILCSVHHLTIKVSQYVIKKFNDKLCSLAYLPPFNKVNSTIHKAAELFNRNIYFINFRNAPYIINYYPCHNVIVYEQLFLSSGDVFIEHIKILIENIQNYGKAIEGEKHRGINAILREIYISKEFDSYSNYYDLGNNINRTITKGIECSHRIHPQLDIKFMFEFHLNQMCAFPICFKNELAKISERLLSLDFIIDEIWLAHGAISEEHLLMKNNILYLIDYETARFAVGELDAAIWIVDNYIWIDKDFEMEEIIEISHNWSNNKNSFHLLLIWEISEIMYRIIRIHAYSHFHYLRMDKYIQFAQKVSIFLNGTSKFN